jgi:hypothetical protein
MKSSIIYGAYENYYQSSLYRTTRYLEEEVYVISIPQDLMGINLEPSTISFEFSGNGKVGTVKDNGEGKLLLSDTNIMVEDPIVGDCIYSHGMIIITDKTLSTALKQATGTLSWKSNLPILTTTVNCTLQDYEFNFTQNPSAITGSDGQIRDNLTGSYFQPYITSIGLYNDANELLAVGKFGQPIPKTPHTDMTFVIKLDM